MHNTKLDREMILPKYNSNTQMGRQGVNKVATIVNEIGFIWRELTIDDVGIDGHIEIVSENGNATGKNVAVQIKSGSSYFKEKGNYWQFHFEEKHKNYWENHPLPVFVILYHPDLDTCYFTDIRQNIRECSNTNNTVSIPKTNVFNASSKSIFEDIYLDLNIEQLSIPNLLSKMVMVSSNNASFPVSFLSLFSAGLTNICYSLFFSMDVVLNVAECRSDIEKNEFGVGIDCDFLFDYIKFLIRQNIIQAEITDYLIDWNKREMVPQFLVPLTTRGRKLVEHIHAIETEVRNTNNLNYDKGIHIAQESIIHVFTGDMGTIPRIYLTKEFEDIIKNNK